MIASVLSSLVLTCLSVLVQTHPIHRKQHHPQNKLQAQALDILFSRTGTGTLVKKRGTRATKKMRVATGGTYLVVKITGASIARRPSSGAREQLKRA